MRVHYLQHVEFEGLGSIEPWLLSAGHQIAKTRLYAGELPPSVDQFDWLIVMGGPMSANDDALLAWLPPEKQCIREAIEADKFVLGICLGAQLIAAVLGAKVFKNPQREIGWFEIRRSAGADQHALGEALPEKAEVFHWHGDTFDLPVGAVRLAESEACLNQAFARGDRVLALQFHLETTPAAAMALVDNCRDERCDAPFIQTAEQMLARTERFQPLNQLMADVLQAFSHGK